MKKTLTINLNGIVFHIDEDAYEALSRYLESLKRHFGKHEGADDILQDIEARIAELLSAKCSETKQVITIDDVGEVISVMGQPAEMDDDNTSHASGTEDRNDTARKRFFRNPDEKLVAGVCSGIAAYFHVDPVWIRLLFVVSLFAGGFGIILYIILWIVLPEAIATTDKLEMRGEKITISNIEKSIKEEVGGLKSRISNMATDSASTIKKAGSGSGEFFETVGKGIAEVLKFSFKVLVIICGIVLALFSLGLLIALVAYVFGWTTGFYSDTEVSIFSFPLLAQTLLGCSMPIGYLQAILMMVLGIPLFMLFYNGLRMVFRFERIRHLGLTMFNIWVIGFFFMVWIGFKVYNMNRYGEEKQLNIPIGQPAADTLHVSLMADDPGMAHLYDEKFILPDDNKTIITDNQELFIVPRIRLEESDDSLFSVTQVAVTRGRSRLEALRNLAEMRFSSAAMGSSLKISPFARLPRGVCWHGQAVNLTIRVPKGKHVSLDKGFEELKPNWIYWMKKAKDGSLIYTNEISEKLTQPIDSIPSDSSVVE